MRNYSFFGFFIALLLLSACGGDTAVDKNAKLPILGNRDVVDGDTIYHQVPDFSFTDQDGNTVNNATFQDKIYVVDFFFIHCPSICPTVTRQMLRIYEKFETVDQVKLLAHTLDVKRDTVGALKKYAEKIHVKSEKWHFVTGEEDLIYDMADDYFIAANKDPDAPGGFDHSGRLILVDKNRRVRAFCEGTDEEDVTRFFGDIQKLLDEG